MSHVSLKNQILAFSMLARNHGFVEAQSTVCSPGKHVTSGKGFMVKWVKYFQFKVQVICSVYTARVYGTAGVYEACKLVDDGCSLFLQ